MPLTHEDTSDLPVIIQPLPADNFFYFFICGCL